jgi:predicted nuclease of predicted toxin-antitoxin system
VSRLLADENIPRPAVTALRAAGHDIFAIQENAPGAADEDVLAVARAQSRILLTFDLDMGQLIFERRLGAPTGIIVFREVPPTLADTVELITALLDRQDLTFEGHFTVVTLDRIRQRPLPAV